MTTPSLAWEFPSVEDRAHPRFPVALPAFLIINDRNHSAQVADIASGGAMIETDVRVTIGFPIHLRCGSIVARGIPVWKDGQRLGFKFDAPLSDIELEEQHARSRAIAALRKKSAR